MKYDERACKFNMDTGCVELLLRDGRKISIDCTGVEDELDVTMAQRSELDYLIYNDPLGYADLILNGDPKEYLKNVTGSHRLEDYHCARRSCCSARSGFGQSSSSAQALSAPSERLQCTRQGNSFRCLHHPREAIQGSLSAWSATVLHSGVHGASAGCGHCRFQRSS